MNKKNILVIAGIVALLSLLAIYAPGNQSTPPVATEGNSETPELVHGPHLTIDPLEYDFGKIRQSDGVVSTTFNVFNNGSEDVNIDDVLTSCTCTSAEIDTKLIRPGERGTLKVSFDPNFHYEDDGRFFRTATIKSNVHGEAPEVKIFVEVDYDLGKDKLKFPGKSE